MIIGSGLIARVFLDAFANRDDVCIYAAGVSNSSCVDSREFEREQLRLLSALDKFANVDVFIYFSTCSVFDPEAYNKPYVQHKLAMEKLVSEHSSYLIIRLPQAVGRTPNPHTLLNYLHARIARSETFHLWNKAKRNIIDIDDIVSIVREIISDPSSRSITVNVANPINYSIMEIVIALERVTGKQAVYVVDERGTDYTIDIQRICPLLKRVEVKFDDNYLERIIGKYYGKNI